MSKGALRCVSGRERRNRCSSQKRRRMTSWGGRSLPATPLPSTLRWPVMNPRALFRIHSSISLSFSFFSNTNTEKKTSRWVSGDNPSKQKLTLKYRVRATLGLIGLAPHRIFMRSSKIKLLLILICSSHLPLAFEIHGEDRQTHFLPSGPVP